MKTEGKSDEYIRGNLRKLCNSKEQDDEVIGETLATIINLLLEIRKEVKKVEVK